MLSIATAGGLRGLGTTAGYTCSATICYAVNSSATDTLFRRLQGAINTASRFIGMGGSITVDGKLGPQTLQRVKDISTNMPSRPDLSLLMTTDSGTTLAYLAANAARYVDDLEGLTEIQMPAEDARPAPTPTPQPTAQTPPPSRAGAVQTTSVVSPNVVKATGPIDPYTGMPTGKFAWTPKTKLALAGSAVGLLGLLFVMQRRKRAAPAATAPALLGFLSGYQRHRRRRR